ncbi:MAG: NADH-quinone oxidoreductase subunit A [Deltaproteobacteria bacterium]|nr:NADH-quinone oxidoreductase subunit A [Deltaproteobacteria bacterium]MBI2500638.1 NADH-quinone oxidoreductase subunit A [Deltaproteobacteria bacterium]MBI4197407.1 NADH-quinone oxidoreductase subunit A [Deltaproteobacteria bacterium]
MNPYFSLLLLFAFALLIGGGFILLSQALGPRKRKATKELPYECGVDPIDEPRRRFSVKFYLVAMLFIVFDVEVVFLYPWAVLYKEFIRSGLGMFVFVEMALFLGILVAGLLYIYGRRALEWE